VLPVKILNFESIAKPNMSKAIQKSQNLLSVVLSEITTFNEIEKRICEKTFEIIDDMGIDISKRSIIFSESTKKQICKGLFKKLTDSERNYLDENNGLATYNGQVFSVNYKYFESLYEKTCIYIQNLEIKE